MLNRFKKTIGRFWTFATMKNTKVVFASTTKIEELHAEVSEILWQIASMMKEPDESEEEWLNYAFVSDEARLIEFLYEDSEIEELRKRLDLPTITKHNSFVHVASALRSKKAERLVSET